MEFRWEYSKQATAARPACASACSTRGKRIRRSKSACWTAAVSWGDSTCAWMAEFQVSEIRLDAADAASTLRLGVRLRQTGGTSPVWILTGSGS